MQRERFAVRLMIVVFVLSLLPIGPQLVSRAEITPAMEPEFQSTGATGQNTAVRDAHKKKCGKKGKKSDELIIRRRRGRGARR